LEQAPEISEKRGRQTGEKALERNLLVAKLRGIKVMNELTFL
jgi:hypothetical protein